MDEGERELRLLRERVLDTVNALRNRMTAVTTQLRELQGTDLPGGGQALVTGLVEEVRQTLVLGEELLAAAGHERREPPHPARGSGAAASAPAHVLVVEDDASNRTILARILRKLGHHVTPVADGIEAYDVLTIGGVDCIVSDYQMPHLGGGSLYQQVENRLPEYAARFVFVTGDYTREETRAFLERTGQPVLGKPYELEELAAAVAGVLARHRH